LKSALVLETEQAKQVTAIEIDPCMAAKVMKQMQGVYVFTLVF